MARAVGRDPLRLGDWLVPMASKKVSAVAVGALEEALANIYWFKKDLEKFVHRSVKNKDLLNGIEWRSNPKRESIATLIGRMQDRPEELMDLMDEVARMDSFTHLERLPEGGSQKAQAAREAVAVLRDQITPHQEREREKEKNAERISEQQTAATQALKFNEELSNLKEEFLGLVSEEDARKRGYQFEQFLTRLFELFGLKPRAPFRIAGEQIDGAFDLDGKYFLLEAKWLRDPVERLELDGFAAKVGSKIKGTLGLFIAFNGVKENAIEAHSKKGALMIIMDGTDLMAVLEGRIRLDRLLNAKHRHAAETGAINLPVADILQ